MLSCFLNVTKSSLLKKCGGAQAGGRSLTAGERDAAASTDRARDRRVATHRVRAPGKAVHLGNFATAEEAALYVARTPLQVERERRRGIVVSHTTRILVKIREPTYR